MRNMIFVTVFCLQALLAGCAGVGIVSTSDPLTKLNDADYLFTHENRPLPAERLIFEAMEIYQSQNDQLGLGHANREYGELLLSSSVTDWEKVYRENGFRDKSVTFDTRAAKSKEYFSHAIEHYQAAEKQLQESKKFDRLTNVYFNMAWSYHKLDDRKNACEYSDKSLAAYTENIRLNPDSKPNVPAGYDSFAEVVATQKSRMDCN